MVYASWYTVHGSLVMVNGSLLMVKRFMVHCLWYTVLFKGHWLMI